MLNNVAGLTRRTPAVYAEYNIQSQQTQSLTRNDDDDYGINALFNVIPCCRTARQLLPVISQI